MIIRPTTTSYRKCRINGQQTRCALTFLTVAHNYFFPRRSLTISLRHLSSLHLCTNLRIHRASTLTILSILTP